MEIEIIFPGNKNSLSYKLILALNKEKIKHIFTEGDQDSDPFIELPGILNKGMGEIGIQVAKYATYQYSVGHYVEDEGKYNLGQFKTIEEVIRLLRNIKYFTEYK